MIRSIKDSLSKYPELRERMQSFLQQGEKITPKQWKEEIQSLQTEYDSIKKEQPKIATELAYAEVISVTTRRTLQGSFRTRTNSIIVNRIEEKGENRYNWKLASNVNVIVVRLN